MADQISEIIAIYQRRLMDRQFSPAMSYGRLSFGREGVVTKLFLTFLFCDKEMSLQFLKDVGLIRTKMTCSSCGSNMTWSSDGHRKDGYRWRCRKRTSSFMCSVSASIRHGSWFRQCNLTLMEVMFLTYDIVRRVPAHSIHLEHQFGSGTIADWGLYCREAMLVYVKGCSRRIGGPNKTVEIDESRFGRRKDSMGRPLSEQWVFGGVERESGNIFLVPVKDRTADTLMAVISDWVEPGTTVISDCSASYHGLEAHGYTHETVKRTIGFVDQRTGAHINTIQSTWRHVRAFLNPYNRGGDYVYHLAQYMFMVRCKAENVDEFTKFIQIVANIDWNQTPACIDIAGAT